MERKELDNLIEDIKLSFGDGAISTVNTMEDEEYKRLSVSVITKSQVTVMSKEDSVYQHAVDACESYMIKIVNGKLALSFEFKYE